MCLLVSGCTTSGATKAGPGLPPVSLRLATVEAEGAAYTEDVERFLSEVDRLSDGAVRISVDWMAVPWRPDSEQELLDQALDAQLELVLLPTRVFDLRDIEVFQALQAPLVIDSAEVAGAVATSPTCGVDAGGPGAARPRGAGTGVRGTAAPRRLLRRSRRGR
jgi:TRAP-type C4-dicarboxylate transport system substrate-binding protein